MTVGVDKVVVNTKKVINKNPRSTIGVRSILVDFFTNTFFLFFVGVIFSMAAMVLHFL